jgi:hypothetical protein
MRFFAKFSFICIAIVAIIAGVVCIYRSIKMPPGRFSLKNHFNDIPIDKMNRGQLVGEGLLAIIFGIIILVFVYIYIR